MSKNKNNSEQNNRRVIGQPTGQYRKGCQKLCFEVMRYENNILFINTPCNFIYLIIHTIICQLIEINIRQLIQPIIVAKSMRRKVLKNIQAISKTIIYI